MPDARELSPEAARAFTYLFSRHSIVLHSLGGVDGKQRKPVRCVTARLLRKGLVPGIGVEYDAIDSCPKPLESGEEMKGEVNGDERSRFHVNAMTSTGMEGILQRYGRVVILPIDDQPTSEASSEVIAAANFENELDGGGSGGDGDEGAEVTGRGGGGKETVRVRVLDRAGYLDFWRERCIDEREQVWRELRRLGLVIDAPFARVYARGCRGPQHSGTHVPANALTAPPGTGFEAATAKAAGAIGDEWEFKQERSGAGECVWEREIAARVSSVVKAKDDPLSSAYGRASAPPSDPNEFFKVLSGHHCHAITSRRPTTTTGTTTTVTATTAAAAATAGQVGGLGGGGRGEVGDDAGVTEGKVLAGEIILASPSSSSSAQSRSAANSLLESLSFPPLYTRDWLARKGAGKGMGCARRQLFLPLATEAACSYLQGGIVDRIAADLEQVRKEVQIYGRTDLGIRVDLYLQAHTLTRSRTYAHTHARAHAHAHTYIPVTSITMSTGVRRCPSHPSAGSDRNRCCGKVHGGGGDR